MIQAVGREKNRIIELIIETKEIARKLRSGDNNIFTTSLHFSRYYDEFSIEANDVSPSTMTPIPCHILSESEPGIYGSTEGTVVEVSFQYDVVTNKTLQSSTYTEIVQNI